MRYGDFVRRFAASWDVIVGCMNGISLDNGGCCMPYKLADFEWSFGVWGLRGIVFGITLLGIYLYPAQPKVPTPLCHIFDSDLPECSIWDWFVHMIKPVMLQTVSKSTGGNRHPAAGYQLGEGNIRPMGVWWLYCHCFFKLGIYSSIKPMPKVRPSP